MKNKKKVAEYIFGRKRYEIIAIKDSFLAERIFKNRRKNIFLGDDRSCMAAIAEDAATKIERY